MENGRKHELGFDCSHRDWISEMNFPVTLFVLRQLQRTARSAQSNATFQSRSTECVSFGMWKFGQYKPDQDGNRFGSVLTHTPFANTKRPTKANAHEQFGCDVHKTNFSVIFTGGSITFLVDQHNHRFKPVLRNLLLCPIDRWSFLTAMLTLHHHS